MKNKRLRLILIVLLLAGFTGSGLYLYYCSPLSDMRREDALHYLIHKPVVQKVMGWAGLSEETALKGEKIYWCPMHPQVRRDKPGACPICNMQLVEMAEGKEAQGDVLVFTDRQVQQAGVRTSTVKTLNLTREIETTGRIDVDERLLKTVSNWVRGKSRIEKLHVNFTGEAVQKGQLLLSLYSPDLITTQEEYLLLLKEDNPPLIKAAEVRLKRWGISREQIENIRKTGRPLEKLPIYSPIAGTVIERLAAEGRYVTEGAPLLKLADLSKLWIYGDIYEYELPFISVGMPVEVSPEGIPGKTIDGNVDFIDPVVQRNSRTVRVRFEVKNEEGLLRPGMYAKLRIDVPQQKMLAVPESGVLLSGRRAVAIISEGNGLMRPVEVKLGRKWFYADRKEEGPSFLDNEERYHEVLSGLKEGQEIIVAGNFLIAAEAQFQGMLKKMLPPDEKEDVEKLPERIEAAVVRIFESYEKIRRALVSDDTGPVKETALNLLDDIDRAAGNADGEVAGALKELQKSAAQMTEGLADIKEIRRSFDLLSRALISWIGRYGLPAGVERQAFTCPMTEGNNPWLQPGKTIDNPYMGRKMSTCGLPLSLEESRP